MSENLFEELRQIVPERFSKFKKLGDDTGTPYDFLHYGVDLADQSCLYYRSKASASEQTTQRVVLDELEQWLYAAKEQNLDVVDQKTFRQYCPRSSKHPTAYTVAIRLLEHLGIGKHIGRGLVLFS